MALDYGALNFDSVMIANEIKNLVELNTLGKDMRERVLDQMEKGVHAKTLFSETQKAFLICTTNLLIHSAARYIVTSALPNFLQEMRQKAEEQGSEFDIEDNEIKSAVTNLILAEEQTVDRMIKMVTNLVEGSKETIKEMDPDKIHIDTLYGMPEGTCVNIALDLFVAVTAENELFKTYTHILIIDDVHGTFTPIQLDPKIISFTPKLEEQAPEEEK